MTVISEVRFSKVKQVGRIDAEYYQPHLLRYENEVSESNLGVAPLGKLIYDGYRVIYENTKIIDNPLPSQKTVRFLQAANIQSRYPAIDYESVGLVSYVDWERYPKGRIRHGEILVEVKGKASKVAIVPDGYPLNTLVTGTVYKFMVDQTRVHRLYLLAYLLSKYGCGFRARCLTNTLIGFVNKDELYRIPVPIPDEQKQNAIASMMEKSFSYMNQSTVLYAQAESLLLSEVGVGDLDLSQALFCERSFCEVRQAARLDAEFYLPKYDRAISILKAKRSRPLSEVASVQKGHQAQVTDAEHGQPYASIKDIAGFILQSEGVTTDSPLVYVEPNGLALAITGATIGKVGINTSNQRIAVCGDLLAIGSKIVPFGFLQVVLGSPMIQCLCRKYTSGATNGHLSPRDVSQFPIPILSPSAISGIHEQVVNAIGAREQSRRLLDEAKRMVEEAILS